MIRMSEEVLDALIALRDFLYETVYERPKIRDEFDKAQRILSELWELLPRARRRVPRATLAEGHPRIRRAVPRRRRLHHRDDRPLRDARVPGVFPAAPLASVLTRACRGCDPVRYVAFTKNVRRRNPQLTRSALA